MKNFAIFVLAMLLLSAAAPVLACIPPPPDPKGDAVLAEYIIIGRVIKEHIPTLWQRLFAFNDPLFPRFTIRTTKIIKGAAPSSVEVSVCNGLDLGEDVIVVQRATYRTIHSTNDWYERELMTAIRAR